MIKQFLILIQFMTRIPVFVNVEYDEEKLGKSIKYFPLVGAVIGIFLFGINFLAGKVTGNRQIIAVIIVVAEIFITGILHIDGLADTFDGLFSYAKKERMLEIMKDSRIGTNGAVVLILYFITKIILLSEVKPEYILLYPIISRLSTSMNAGLGEYARKDGMSNSIIEKNGPKEAVISVVITAVLSFLILKIKGLGVLAAAIVFILIFMRNVKKKIGGITGDTMGASLELTSILILLTGVILK
ncbi:adenosylcobinamide-GDP ribazoletransferase [Pseudoleptotrichia goodfellowii]|uniref:Adenosylcobinamide-GDP ribazoletransferase n=1 Tax=Pseudoleptotrichia goodfellowii TaxID=157692 RepID=A0A510JBN5_9FUSO|nr:adenosylcobinamide-GDP ribazoletransferase [Pseudoleptotrichia goodfellowii]BBM35585.1 cobalamin 5'-phosphate synthase [Pseudoleptotrichia goodfellowii]